MPAYTFISKWLFLVLLLSAGLARGALAAPGSASAEGSPQRVHQPEEEDLKGTPYTEYGEFNEQIEEDENTRFLQYGRYFGVSLGGGLSGVSGNRGLLYQGGFPAFELKMHYWFDFNLALEMAVNTSSHYFDTQARGHVDTTLLRLGVDLKYYIPVYNLAAPITFANPYLTLGFGSFKKSDSFQDEEVVDNDSAAGISLGAGLEFVLSPRRSSFYVSAKTHFVNFKDTYTSLYRTSDNIENLSGVFYDFTTGVLFTW